MRYRVSSNFANRITFVANRLKTGEASITIFTNEYHDFYKWEYQVILQMNFHI
jgi:hypothetical protein